MAALRTVVAVAWIVFWIYWLVSAVAANRGTGRMQGTPVGALIVLLVLIPFLVDAGSLEIHVLALAVIGALVTLSGLAFAVWARIHLGRNWGMPMTQKEEPELITSGPYRFVRHPIYTGLLAAIVGTALTTNLSALVVAAVLAVYFWHSATVEERNLGATFPSAYPAYRTRTKRLIPFVL
ncbi:MAG TPA: isoprenylcysteine carboxylmethyltransferase family protein [Solirubrobacterales bacterium]|jgi:protein-S-isoprenylcysteine O-methyltransferase Ste14|nr:isoprenylcysteine carboxylmethyltransferase family protein [Solirubrobacterales bacterium]